MALILSVMAAGACQGPPGGATTAALPRLDTIVELASPAPTGSTEPFLAATSDGSLLLSWVEPVSEHGHAVRFARFDGARWSEPSTIATGENLFVNWADFPSIAVLPDGRLAAHWLERSGPRTYSYDVRIAVSADGGASWSAPVMPHTDGTRTEHGFVSLFPLGDHLGAIWLDGRNFAGRPEHDETGADMTLRFASIDGGGAIGEEALLDARTCECCQTDAAVTDSGPIVVYRDRSEGEVRDIAILRRIGDAWSDPAIVHADGWVFPGCPVNGPAVAANGQAVAVAWFTAARDTPRVHIAFSGDAGATFGPPIEVDDGAPAGRVDLQMLDGGIALVSWLEHEGDGAVIRVRAVSPDGRAATAVTIAASSAERAAGFPRMARLGGRVFFAWTVPGRPSNLRLAAAHLVPPGH